MEYAMQLIIIGCKADNYFADGKLVPEVNQMEN